MKDKFTISEMARMKNITAETLRHYDRVGILKPSEVDPNTKYRYYSILQYEELSTILELRQLDMSIEEIKEYYKEKNTKKSLEILQKQLGILEKKIDTLQDIYSSVSKKVNHINTVLRIENPEEVVIQEVSKRTVIWGKEFHANDTVMSFARLELEKEINAIAPTVGTNNYGVVLKNNDIFHEIGKEKEKVVVFIVVDEFLMPSDLISIIQSGLYACTYYKGDIFKRSKRIHKISEELTSRGYEICGEIIAIFEIALSVSDLEEEQVYQLQIPIKNISK